MIETEDVGYPGYVASWGSTSLWPGEPKGPFVAFTYTSPDADGISSRSTIYCATFDEAERVAKAWSDLMRHLNP